MHGEGPPVWPPAWNHAEWTGSLGRAGSPRGPRKGQMLSSAESWLTQDSGHRVGHVQGKPPGTPGADGTPLTTAHSSRVQTGWLPAPGHQHHPEDPAALRGPPPPPPRASPSARRFAGRPAAVCGQRGRAGPDQTSHGDWNPLLTPETGCVLLVPSAGSARPGAGAAGGLGLGLEHLLAALHARLLLDVLPPVAHVAQVPLLGRGGGS